MGNIGDAISTLVPAVGAAETAASASVSELLTELKNRLTSKVNTTELDIDAALSLANFGLVDSAYVELVTQVTKPTDRETLYTKESGGVDELFYQDSAGTEVQLTAAGAVNVSATGAITGGGYGAAGVEVNWNAAGDSYLFKNGAGSDDYADVIVDDLILRDGSSHGITLDAPALAASWTLELPNAEPASAAMLTMSAGGVLSYTDSTTGYDQLRHGEVEVTLPMNGYHDFGLDSPTYTFQGLLTGTNDRVDVLWELPLKVGDRLKKITLHCVSYSGSTPLDMELWYTDGATAMTELEDTTVNSTGLQTFTMASPYTKASDETYVFRLQATITETFSVANITYTYDRP